MKNRVVVLIVLALSLLLNSSAFAQSSHNEQTLSAELMALEPYILTKQIGQVYLQELDYAGARQAGFLTESLDLASEIVAYQNEYKLSVMLGKAVDDISIQSPELFKFPKLTQFLSEMSSKNTQQQSQNSITADPTPCGNWDYPVPNYTPSRVPYSGYSNPGQTLINWGFHKTAGYACGQDPFVTCDNDYTRGRLYSGPYGVCSSPRFRDQGIVMSSTSFNIQYGEPNPEILAYSWPYWNWGVYVRWWHDNY